MPAASSKKKHSLRTKSNPTKVNKQKSKWIIGSLLVSVFVIFVALMFFMLNSGEMGEQAKMTEYLKEKYNKEFVVKNIRTEGSGLGMPGQKTGDAYFIDKGNLEFEVGRYSTGEFYDTLPSALWSKEATPEAEKAVRQIFSGIMPWMEVEIHPFNPATGRESKTSDLYDNLPKLSTLLKEDPSLLAYKIHVRVTGDFVKEEVLHKKKLQELMKFIADKKTGKGLVRYVINLETEDAMYVCSVSSQPLEIKDLEKAANCFNKFNRRED